MILEEKMKRLFMFDLDGTVLDTLGTISYYANAALEKNGVAPIEKNEYKYLVGKGIANLVHGMLTYRECYSDALYESVFCDYNTAYNADVSFGTVIYPGVKETLDALKSRGVKIAIISNKPDFATQGVVEKIFGKGYFDFVTGQKPGAPLKPDPTVVLSVMQAFHAAPEECAYIGDTGGDMKTGKNAGVLSLGVLWGFRESEELLGAGADALIERAEELLEYV